MKTKIYDQHSEHAEWLNKLTFYSDEIRILQKRLEEIGSKNNAEEVRKQIEHFQNQFIIQNRNIDEISRHIRQEEKMVQASIRDNMTASDHRKTDDHGAEREAVNQFESNFNNLRKEFNLFAAKWM